MKPIEKSSAEDSPAARPYSERQEHLLDALEEIFLQEGFRSVAVGELAARLHCSRSTLYGVAPSKQRLFLVVLERLLARIRELAHAAYHDNCAVQERVVRGMTPGVAELRKAGVLFFADIAGFDSEAVLQRPLSSEPCPLHG